MFDIFRSLYVKLVIAFVIVLAVGVGLATLLISRFTTNEFGYYLRSPILSPGAGIPGPQFFRGNQGGIQEAKPEPRVMRQRPLGKPGEVRGSLQGRLALNPEQRQLLMEAQRLGPEEMKQVVESFNLSLADKQMLLEDLDRGTMPRRPPGKAREGFDLQSRFALTPQEWRGLRKSLISGPEETKRYVESLNISEEDKQSLQEYINRGMIRTMFPPPGIRLLMERLGEAERNFLDEVDKYLWLSAAIAFLVAIFVSLIFTRQILSPLRRLALASHNVASGNFKSRVEIKSRDEIGKLGLAFNQMAQTLQVEKEREKALLADVSHELRTPLSILGGKLEAMLDDVIKPTPEQLASMHDEVLLLSRLVQDLQTLSTAEAGRLEMHFTQTDIKALASRVVSSFKNLADSKNITLLLEASKDIPSLAVDQDRISQVLRNLLSNALRYTPAGGKVEVKIEFENSRDKSRAQAVQEKIPYGQVLFKVSDNGPGIPAEEIPHIFERFHRGDPSRSRATGGSGLGLAIAKQLVEAHQGKTWVESEEGKGSAFHFTLPGSSSPKA